MIQMYKNKKYLFYIFKNTGKPVKEGIIIFGTLVNVQMAADTKYFKNMQDEVGIVKIDSTEKYQLNMLIDASVRKNGVWKNWVKLEEGGEL